MLEIVAGKKGSEKETTCRKRAAAKRRPDPVNMAAKKSRDAICRMMDDAGFKSADGKSQPCPKVTEP